MRIPSSLEVEIELVVFHNLHKTTKREPGPPIGTLSLEPKSSDSTDQDPQRTERPGSCNPKAQLPVAFRAWGGGEGVRLRGFCLL